MGEEKRPTCPHCGEPMEKWALPEESTWPDDYHYVCFNDECEYYVKGWDFMEAERGTRCSYRHMCSAEGRKTGPLPVPTPEAGKDRIIRDETDQESA